VKQDLAVLLQQAKGGQVYRLQPGNYGRLALKNLRFETPVIIDGGDKAYFERIELARVHNLTFRNIVVEAGTTEKPRWEIAVNIWRSSNIKVLSSDIHWSADNIWTNDGIALTARLSDTVTFKENRIHDSIIGIVARDADNILIEENEFTDIRVDGVNVSGTQKLVFENNLCTNFHPIRPKDHPDCIQLWNDTAKRSNVDIFIRSNKILRGEGGVSQGIFIAGKQEGLLHTNLVIENNTIHQGMGMGIFLRKVDGAVVRHNQLSAAEPVEFPPAIAVREPVTGVRLENNVAHHFEVADPMTESGRVVMTDNVSTR
jgi:hypothetical protein